MDSEARARDLLESMLLDTTAEPEGLPLLLLESITNNFSDDQVIGRGGFSVVYQGRLRNGTIAVKRLSQELDMDEKNFNNELISLIRLKHKNIVRFLGYCAHTQGKVEQYKGHMVVADIRQRLLCFEYLPNGGLDKHINDKSCKNEWRTYYQIIKGICVGLHYLHQQNIVHGDLKPANILLDYDMVPKIADFGRSRCFDKEQTREITTNVVGTRGYMAPEFFNSGVITLKSDIYSLGIVIIELLTGQKEYLQIDKVIECWRTRFQTSLESTSEKYARVIADIGLKCIDSDSTKRPKMQQIIETLDKSEHISPLSSACITRASGQTNLKRSNYGKMMSGHHLAEIVYTIGDELSYTGFIKTLRPMLADHPDREDIMDRYGSSVHFTGEHPVLPKQRADQPARWIHIKLQAKKGEEMMSTTLLMRDDNLYVCGFINQQGELFELIDNHNRSTNILPVNEYKARRLSWGGSYRSLLEADTEDDLVEILALEDMDCHFMMEAMYVLSRFPAWVDDHMNPRSYGKQMNPRMALAGLIVMVCESARMNRIHNFIVRCWGDGRPSWWVYKADMESRESDRRRDALTRNNYVSNYYGCGRHASC